MNNDNIIKLERNNDADDISQQKTVSLKQAAEILGLSYHKTRRIILNSGEIGFFDYDGTYAVVETDIKRYKINHYKKPLLKIN